MAFDRIPEGKSSYLQSERRFKWALRSALPWNWGSVQIEVDGDAGGVQYLGSLLPMGPRAQRTSLEGLSAVLDLQRELETLLRASREQPRGPWYHCRIALNRFGGAGFDYWWEGDPLRSLDDLHPRIDGRLPLFVFARPLAPGFLAALPPARAALVVAERVARLLRDRRMVAEPLLEVAAVHDWLGSLGGGLDPFFLGFEPPGLHAAGVRMLRAVYSGLPRLGFGFAQPVFAEALRIYASHLVAAGEACASLDLEPASFGAVRDNTRMRQLAAIVAGEALACAAALGQHVVDHAQELAGLDGAVSAVA